MEIKDYIKLGIVLEVDSKGEPKWYHDSGCIYVLDVNYGRMVTTSHCPHILSAEIDNVKLGNIKSYNFYGSLEYKNITYKATIEKVELAKSWISKEQVVDLDIVTSIAYPYDKDKLNLE